MEKISVTASVNVTGGPAWRVAADVQTEVYAVASVSLDASGEGDVTLMPAGAVAALLVIRAVTNDGGQPANVTVTPEGSAAGEPLSVTGSLLVTNASVLAGLAADGPSKLTVENGETEAVTVSVLVAFD